MWGDTFLTSTEEELKSIAALIADLNHHQALSYLKNSLENYSINQSLFVSNSKLLSHCLNRELIPSSQFPKDYLSNIVQFANDKDAYLEEILEPPILQQLEERGATYFVRINPNSVYDTHPHKLIKEAARHVSS